MLANSPISSKIYFMLAAGQEKGQRALDLVLAATSALISDNVAVSTAENQYVFVVRSLGDHNMTHGARMLHHGWGSWRSWP